jgi:membrane fusion protein, heavy metal efflux system
MKKLALLLFCMAQLQVHELNVAAEEGFRWTKEKTEFGNIQVAIAGPGKIQNFCQVSGKVIIHPDHLAYVIPKVAGSVLDVKKNLGNLVEKDEILALLDSREIAEAKSKYLTALKKFDLSQTLLDKEKLLKGISSGQDYLNAKMAADEAYINLQLALQDLYALGFSKKEIDKIETQTSHDLRFYEVRSPIKGKVLERNLTLGESIDGSTIVFKIGNFEHVWVEISVPQNDIQYLKENLPIEIVADGGKQATIKISQFNPMISEETRCATAIAMMKNDSEKWSPGEYVTVNIQTEETNAAIVVPLTAIQMIKGQECIFVENGEEFLPSYVKLGKKDRENVEIVSGITPGIVYAAHNTFCLKAEYEKEEAEHSH